MEGVPDGEGAWGTRAAVPAWWGKTEDPPKRPLQAGGATEGGGARVGGWVHRLLSPAVLELPLVVRVEMMRPTGEPAGWRCWCPQQDLWAMVSK